MCRAPGSRGFPAWENGLSEKQTPHPPSEFPSRPISNPFRKKPDLRGGSVRDTECRQEDFPPPHDGGISFEKGSPRLQESRFGHKSLFFLFRFLFPAPSPGFRFLPMKPFPLQVRLGRGLPILRFILSLLHVRLPSFLPFFSPCFCYFIPFSIQPKKYAGKGIPGQPPGFHARPVFFFPFEFLRAITKTDKGGIPKRSMKYPPSPMISIPKTANILLSTA